MVQARGAGKIGKWFGCQVHLISDAQNDIPVTVTFSLQIV